MSEIVFTSHPIAPCVHLRATFAEHRIVACRRLRLSIYCSAWVGGIRQWVMFDGPNAAIRVGL
jgi:hypothetical protein